MVSMQYKPFSVDSHHAEEDCSVAQSVSGVGQLAGEGRDALSGASARWAQCIAAAPPRARNRSEIEVAYKQTKTNFYDSSGQIQKYQDDVDASYNSTDPMATPSRM